MIHKFRNNIVKKNLIKPILLFLIMILILIMAFIENNVISGQVLASLGIFVGGMVIKLFAE